MNDLIPASEYCDRIFDGTHETPKPTEVGHLLVTSKNIAGGTLDKNTAYFISEADYIEIQRRSYVSQWDVLFSMIGSVGEVYVEKGSNIDYAVKNVGVFSCLDKYKALWLYYYLKSATAQKVIKNKLNGAVQKFLPLGALRSFPIPRYDKGNGPLIDILAALDAKIELNQRMNEELEGMAKLLYDYWFVQYDFPMSAAQAAALGQPGLVGRPYRASGGPMTYHPTLKREIPTGWEVGNLSCMVHSDKSGDWGEEAVTGNYQTEVYCIRGTDLPSLNGIGSSTPPKRFILAKNEFKILKPNDLIIEISGGSPVQSTGRISALSRPVFARYDRPLICSNFCKALSLKPEISVFYFYRTWARLYENGVFFNWEGKTSGIKNLLFDSFVSNHPVVIPHKEITNKFDDALSSFEEVKQKNLMQTQELTALRDWLLPMLMNGQVTVGKTA